MIIKNRITKPDQTQIGDKVVYHGIKDGLSCNAIVIGLFKKHVWIELQQPIKEKISFSLSNIHCAISYNN